MSTAAASPSPTKSYDERINCSECNASVLKFKHMERHVSIHLKRDFLIDLFQCIYCDHTSNRNDKMAEHVKNAHWGEKQVYDDFLSDPNTIAVFERAGRRCFGGEFKSVKLPVNKSVRAENAPDKEVMDAELSSKVSPKRGRKSTVSKRRHLSLPDEEKCISHKVKRTRKTDFGPVSVIKTTEAEILQNSCVEMKRNWTPKVVFQMHTRSKSYAHPSSSRLNKSNKLVIEKLEDRKVNESALVSMKNSDASRPVIENEDDQESDDASPSPELGGAFELPITDSPSRLRERFGTRADVSLTEKTIDATVENGQTLLKTETVPTKVDHIEQMIITPDADSVYESVDQEEGGDESTLWSSSSAPTAAVRAIPKHAHSCQITVVISEKQAMTVCKQVQIIPEDEPAIEDIDVTDEIFKQVHAMPLSRASCRRRAKKSISYVVMRPEENVKGNFGVNEATKTIGCDRSDIPIVRTEREAILI
uniref:C2H2-type domain-containing protein n=1 Tax=Plectus sambesii TaxID=2011161 RepID=A0A914UNN5_9BILA